MSRGLARRRFEIDLRSGRTEQPLHLAHRPDEPFPLPRVERLQRRSRQPVRKLVVGIKLLAALPRQDDPAQPAVAGILARFDESLARQGLQHPAHVAGVEAEPHAQHAHVRPFGSNLEDKARLAERPAAREIARLQRADAQRDPAVEAANPPHLIAVHSLTLVRFLMLASGMGRRGIALPSASPPELETAPTTSNRCLRAGRGRARRVLVAEPGGRDRGPRLRPNSSKPDPKPEQAKPRTRDWSFLDSFVRFGAFQRVTGNPRQKISNPAGPRRLPAASCRHRVTRRLREPFGANPSMPTSLSLQPPRRSIKNSKGTMDFKRRQEQNEHMNLHAVGLDHAGAGTRSSRAKTGGLCGASRATQTTLNALWVESSPTADFPLKPFRT